MHGNKGLTDSAGERKAKYYGRIFPPRDVCWGNSLEADFAERVGRKKHVWVRGSLIWNLKEGTAPLTLRRFRERGSERGKRESKPKPELIGS